MKTTTKLFSVLFFLMLIFSFSPEDEGDRLVGVCTIGNGKARVKVEKIGNKYYGKIVWLREPIDPVTQLPKVDKNNPDASMQNVPLKGYRLLKDFIYSGKNEWTEGTIYDPENGSTYSCLITMKDNNTLDIRGYIGLKALGRTDVWKRLEIKK